MSSKKPTAPEQVQGRGKEVSRYSREELLASTEALFGVKREVLLAALVGDKRTEYSVDEVKNLINEFSQRKVI